jgi:hypothetical protein
MTLVEIIHQNADWYYIGLQGGGWTWILSNLKTLRCAED